MPNAPGREFRVHASHIDSHHSRHVTETSFEAAAVAYIERHPYAGDEDHEIRVVVREVSKTVTRAVVTRSPSWRCAVARAERALHQHAVDPAIKFEPD